MKLPTVISLRKKGSLWLPTGAILVPKTVSYSQRTNRQIQGGTKAFVWSDQKRVKGLAGVDKAIALRRMAEQSSHFIKPLSKRNLHIREILEKYGIRTEKVLDIPLYKGRAVFEREGFALASAEGQKVAAQNPEKFVKTICDTMGKMLGLEITHWHPHTGNFAITKNGEIIVLDLGKATIAHEGKLFPPKGFKWEKGKPIPKTIRKYVEKYHREKSIFADDLVGYYFEITQGRMPTPEERKTMWNRIFDELADAQVRFLKQVQK